MNIRNFAKHCLAIAGALVLAFSLVGTDALAQGKGKSKGKKGKRDFSAVKIRTIPVANNIHVLMGRGGNIGVITGPDGTFMIDDQFAPLSKKIMAAVTAISSNPIRFLLNTHHHGDHTGGNANFGKTGATIIAHRHVRRVLSGPQQRRGRTIPPMQKAGLSSITFERGATFHLNGETLEIKHLPAAHTGGDSFVHFKNANVIHTGDTFFNGFYPFIDVGGGGGIDGIIKAANTILGAANDQTKIIPGHGPMADKKALTAYRDMLVDARKAVASAMQGGKIADQVLAAKPTNAFDGEWGDGFMRPDRFTRIVYSSLKK